MAMLFQIICVVRLTENAIIPTRGSAGAVGLDLYSAYDLTVPARGLLSVKTDLQIQVPGQDRSLFGASFTSSHRRWGRSNRRRLLRECGSYFI